MTAVVSRELKMLVVPQCDLIEGIFPDFVRVGDKLALPHTDDTVRVLNNMGIAAPAPILYQYDWCKQTPFKIQRSTAAMMTTNRRAYILSEMGTGKTRSALYSFDWLKKHGIGKKMLVVAPLSTLTATWAREILTCFPHLSYAVLHGSKTKRQELLATDVDIFIINHDGIKVIQSDLQLRKDINVVLIDEVASLRNTQTDRFKVMQSIAYDRTYVWGMTGSPTPNAPTDAFGQCKLITPERVPKFFRHFRDKTMIQVSQFKFVPKPDANETVQEAMSPAVRYVRDDAFELPPVSYVSREVEMNAKQERAYSEMMNNLHTELEEGSITALNSGIKLNKLLQISCGFAYTNDSEPAWLGANDRLDVVREVFEQSISKVLVFVPFIYPIEIITNYLNKKGIPVESIHGGTPAGKRNEIFARFQQSDSKLPGIVAHPRTMSHGLTLTAANTILWWSPIPSLETYEQANARITRPGQEHKQLIIKLSSSKADQAIYNRLDKRAKMQDALLELLKT